MKMVVDLVVENSTDGLRPIFDKSSNTTKLHLFMTLLQRLGNIGSEWEFAFGHVIEYCLVTQNDSAYRSIGYRNIVNLSRGVRESLNEIANDECRKLKMVTDEYSQAIWMYETNSDYCGINETRKPKSRNILRRVCNAIKG